MLTFPEKVIFLLVALAALLAVVFASRRLARLFSAGKGRPDWRLAWKRLPAVALRVATFQPVFRSRFWVSLFHALVGWGFAFYLLVNLFDALRAFAPAFEVRGTAGDLYRLLADGFSAAVLAAMAFFILRRFVFRPANLTARGTTLLHPRARAGIRRDSAIVAAFIVVHVGARLFGALFSLAAHGQADPWQPFADGLAGLWSGMGPEALAVGEHAAFWLSIGTILAFLPYLPYSKHVHLLFAPLNFLLKPERRSMGEMEALDLEDPSVERFGAETLADLGWEQIMDAYACIMCFRCQDACPAYQTGKVLSPAALEINKRYLLNAAGASLPADRLVEAVIMPEAVWACTACGACVDICPVGNEPMRDILEVRRGLVLMEDAYPRQLENSFRNLERSANPWGLPAAERMKWAEGIPVPTLDGNPHPDLLWWVGCAPASEARAQETARAFARILEAAGVDYAVLGREERCTGDSARRAGREDIFAGLARANVERLNSVAPQRIVTTCPHCLHVLKNEYPAFGGNYEVIHHTQLIEELIAGGRLVLESEPSPAGTVFHDPCYLGRQNGVVAAPRRVLEAAGERLAEMPRRAGKSFCCGAGGAQMWKEEEPGEQRVSAARLSEARASGAATLAVGCPFCLVMLGDAAREAPGETDGMQVRDVAEVVAGRIVKQD